MKGFEKHRQYIHPEDSSRRRDVSRSRNNIDVYAAEEEVHTLSWAIQNSPLLRPENAEADLSYNKTFRELLPQGMDLRDFIETGLAEKKGRAIGIDIGGLGSEVFAGFSPGFFERTAGVSLVDNRYLHHIELSKDAERQHSVIAGDFFQQETRKRIEEWLDGEKADLIFERMAGGLEVVPRDARIVTAAMESLYESLSDVGMMFLQLNFRVFSDLKYGLLDTSLISAWQEEVMQQANVGLHIAVDSREDTVLIQKLAGAPLKLPGLDVLKDYSRRIRSVTLD